MPRTDRRGDDLGARTRALVVRKNEYGFDPFGFHPDHLNVAAKLARFLYRTYFRAESHGTEHIPSSGRVMFIANHSGQLPFDGLVIGAAVFLEPPQPRLVRSMVEHFVPTVPFASYLLSRWGQIIGTPENCRRLLRQDEAILVFPEGAKGISKPFSRRGCDLPPSNQPREAPRGSMKVEAIGDVRNHAEHEHERNNRRIRLL